MKGKISSIWRVVIAVVLAASLGMVMVMPVAAAVGPATVTPYPPNMSNAAEYSITFTTNEDLAITADDDIRIRFPADTVVPGAYNNTSISINGTDVDTGVAGVDVTVTPATREFIIDVPEDIAAGTLTVVFKGPVPGPNAGIVNPSTKGFYTLQVSTSREVSWVESYEYEITGPMGPVDLYLKHVAECGYIEHEYVNSYDYIQEALDMADTLFLDGPYWGWYGYAEMPGECNYVGARVEVHPGTYDEMIVIDTPFVEVVAPDGATIDADGLEPSDSNYPAAVAITAGGVTFDGFTVINAGVGVDADGTWPDVDLDTYADIKGILVYMDSAKNQVPIHDAEEVVIADTYAWMARVNILNNEVYGSTAHGIAAWSACVLVTGNNVHDNEFDGFFGYDVFVGVETLDPTAFTHGLSACTEINDNTFADNGEGRDEFDIDYPSTDNGIQIWSAYANPPETIYIVGNEIYRNSNAGIYLGDGIQDKVIIKLNQIEDNDVFGISSHMRYPKYDIVCIYNDIAGNLVWGIKNWEGVDDVWLPDDDDVLIATLNYFGHLSGPSCGPAPVAHDPSQQSLALGQGDAVSHWVEYKWWLTDSFKDVRDDLIRYYGSDCYDEGYVVQTTPIVPLYQGWNTMSTPVALDQRADTMGEIAALGGWMQNYVIGYSYDPVSGWDLLDANFQLKPLEAVYVRMAGPDTLPILLRATNYMPARDLAAGWNLVGPNFGFWSQNTWSMPVDETLSSIAGSWGVALSPDMPGQQEAWACTPATAHDEDMYVGDGYWVFVTQPTTLAGFRMAPWYLQDWEMNILACQLPPWWQ